MNGPLLQYEDIGENNSHIEQIDEATVLIYTELHPSLNTKEIQ